ncbi:tRNA (5-methylaminomethyl-2-thiouridine)(34)-methyltransferase MnmD [Hydrogenimonas urashimensis]|uniref:tRNA (5-methylaminomethyl-2-thiouridine)(34)-methyltransferase MnmD n=1 Tax=Hydrogenimonas urashimensis TaxID=2740515 RepID=UPI001915B215|nr:MnmC family methyltransferase [Hydrogenimonas urashimensis]
MKHLTLVETQDGTFTARSDLFDECYHSTRDGALKESLKKHVEPAFSLIGSNRDRITVLDICFGLGYNTLSTLYYLKKNALAKKLRIVSPEFDEALVRSLSDFPYPEALKPFKEAIDSIAKTGKYENGGISIEVIFGDAREFLRSTDETFDIVYQDAFSPKKNPMLWTKEYFADLTAHLAEDGIVTTYSSATPVRMGMAENGLHLYLPPSREVRSGTIASLRDDLPLVPIDMRPKKERNPLAAPLCDKDIVASTLNNA